MVKIENIYSCNVCGGTVYKFGLNDNKKSYKCVKCEKLFSLNEVMRLENESRIS